MRSLPHHDVHREDTLQGICVRWSVSMRDLRKLNIGLTKDSDLRSCTVLNIPVLGPEDKVRRQAQSLVLSFPGSGLTDEKARDYLKVAGNSYEVALAIAKDEINAEKETKAAQVCPPLHREPSSAAPMPCRARFAEHLHTACAAHMACSAAAQKEASAARLAQGESLFQREHRKPHDHLHRP